MSSDEAIDRLEKYILKIMGSQKMLKTLKTNLVVRRFTKKLSEVWDFLQINKFFIDVYLFLL